MEDKYSWEMANHWDLECTWLWMPKQLHSCTYRMMFLSIADTIVWKRVCDTYSEWKYGVFEGRRKSLHMYLRKKVLFPQKREITTKQGNQLNKPVNILTPNESPLGKDNFRRTYLVEIKTKWNLKWGKCNLPRVFGYGVLLGASD